MRMCGYARVSTDEERQLDSLEHQMEFFSDFAKQNGHHLVNVYTAEYMRVIRSVLVLVIILFPFPTLSAVRKQKYGE